MRVMNLRDVQDLIERGEYDTHRVSQWKPIYFCNQDGTIYRHPEEHCPSPYHPNPPPYLSLSLRGLLHLAIISICLAIIYSIINNEELVTLIVTVLLLIISTTVFTALFLGFTYLNLKIAPRAAREEGRKFLGFFSSVLSGVFAMTVVALWQRQFPSLSWWLIEFSIAYVLETFLAGLLTRLMCRLFPELGEVPPSNSALKDEVFPPCIPYVDRTSLKMWHRFAFFSASLALGFWFLCPMLFKAQIPFWVVPVVFVPYVTWLVVFLPKYSAAAEGVGRSSARELSLFVVCAYAASKPAEADFAKRRWLLPLFYASWATPLGCFAITIASLLS